MLGFKLKDPLKYCERCGRPFLRASSLRLHERDHADIREILSLEREADEDEYPEALERLLPRWAKRELSERRNERAEPKLLLRTLLRP